MRSIELSALAFLISLQVLAQAPEKMSYQAVVRDNANLLVAEKMVGMRISILRGSVTGTAAYVETQSPRSNANGLVTLEIGAGTVVSGSFVGINWSSGPYFIQTEIDPSGGSNYSILGVSQLLSVPYALYAKTSGSSTPGPAGPQGPIGPTGPAGSTGQAGAVGPQGPQGPIGLTGPAGTNGSNGAAGSTGPAGPPGPQGDQGPQGPIGLTGPAGTNGSNGAAGSTGPAGPPGPQGAPGPQGPVGEAASSANFVDLTTSQSVAGTKTFTSPIVGSITGNAATVTTNAPLTGAITSLGNVTSITDGAVSDAKITDMAASKLTGTVAVDKGGTGTNTLTGLVKGNGANAMTTATPNVDYQAPLTLTTTGTGAATLTGATLNIPSATSGNPSGQNRGDMLYWNGTAWVTIPAATSNGQILYAFTDGPQWGPLVSPTDVINPKTGKIWMDRNLGATQVATSSTDAASYGDLYQWGREADGHQKRNSGTTPTRSSTDTPGHGDFITIINLPYDWRDPGNPNLWQGVNGINNPCPSGYRLPTEEEWQNEYLSWNSQDAAGAFASPLKLPLAGYRDENGIYDTGTFGYYWSSSTNIFTDLRASLHLTIYNFIGEDSFSRSGGMSVRCIKDVPFD